MTKLLYTINEVADILGISTYRLRSWEKFIPQLRPARTSGNVRRYTARDIDVIRSAKKYVEEDKLPLNRVSEALSESENYIPRPIICKTRQRALALLSNSIKAASADADKRQALQLKAVYRYIKNLPILTDGEIAKQQ